MSEEKAQDQEVKPQEIQIVNVTPEGDAAKITDQLTFTVDWTDEETGNRLVGTFIAKRPTLGVVSSIAVMKAKLNGGERVTADMDFLHEMIAYLHYVLIDVPKWWNPDGFYTATPVRKVWDHVSAWERSFRKKRVG